MKSDALVFKKRDLGYIIIALLLFFQIYLQTIIKPFQYLDEFVAIICLLKILSSSRKLQKSETSILLFMCLLLAVGIVGNFTSDIQAGIKPILTDIGNTFKIFIVYLGAKRILDGSDKRKIVLSISVIVKVFVWLAFVFMLLHELHIVNMGTDIRYGISSFQFINHGAGQFSMMFYFVMVILILDMKYQNRGGARKIKSFNIGFSDTLDFNT